MGKKQGNQKGRRNNSMEKKANDGFRSVEITSESIELAQLLKFEGLVQTGGEGKVLILEGHVRVNGVRETRKSRKIRPGDTVEFRKEKIRLVAAKRQGKGSPRAD